MMELKVMIEPVESVAESAELAENVGGALKNAFSLRIDVEVVTPGELPRFEFKSKRWLKQ